MMRHNGTQYYQLPTGELMSIADLLGEIDGSVETILPPTTHNLHAVRRLPGEMNTDDPARTCPRCSTAYRLSEIKDGCRCPFCWRLA